MRRRQVCGLFKRVTVCALAPPSDIRFTFFARNKGSKPSAPSLAWSSEHGEWHVVKPSLREPPFALPRASHLFWIHYTLGEYVGPLETMGTASPASHHTPRLGDATLILTLYNEGLLSSALRRYSHLESTTALLRHNRSALAPAQHIPVAAEAEAFHSRHTRCSARRSSLAAHAHHQSCRSYRSSAPG